MFELPPSNIDEDGVSSYPIYAKALPAGSDPAAAATEFVRTCTGPSGNPITYYDSPVNRVGYYQVCSAGSLTFSTGGRARNVNVSGQLLTLRVPENLDMDLDSDIEIAAGRYNVFDESLENYYWKYYNADHNPTTGLRLLQLRLYREQP